MQGARNATGGIDFGLPLPGVVLPGMPGLMPGLVPGLGNASRIVVLKNAVDIEELRNPQDYEEIVQDMQVSQSGRKAGHFSP